MTKIDPGSGDEVGYEDVIDDLYFEGSFTIINMEATIKKDC